MSIIFIFYDILVYVNIYFIRSNWVKNIQKSIFIFNEIFERYFF